MVKFHEKTITMKQQGFPDVTHKSIPSFPQIIILQIGVDKHPVNDHHPIIII